MKKDINNISDIELMVNTFYEKVLSDKVLEPIFRESAKVDWKTHLPIMYSFWENVIFFTGTYEGNPVNLHKHLHHITPLTDKHFKQWNQLFLSTVDLLFKGPNADLAKARALNISDIIWQKLQEFQERSA